MDAFHLRKKGDAEALGDLRCISIGEFHFPNGEAAEIAVKAVTDFMESHGDAMDRVIFNVFKDSDREIYERIFTFGL